MWNFNYVGVQQQCFPLRNQSCTGVIVAKPNIVPRARLGALTRILLVFKYTDNQYFN